MLLGCVPSRDLHSRALMPRRDLPRRDQSRVPCLCRQCKGSNSSCRVLWPNLDPAPPLQVARLEAELQSSRGDCEAAVRARDASDANLKVNLKLSLVD